MTLTLYTAVHLVHCRDQVASKYKKKIELLVRKPDKDAEDVPELMVGLVPEPMGGWEERLLL
jgi:hypothetical protein